MSPDPTTCARQDLHYLPSDLPVFSCKECGLVIALQDELCSKGFTGGSGKAFLMNSTVNTNLGKQDERRLLTGKHTCADLLCASCGSSLGWKYIKTPTAEQKYKENRFILEQAKVVKENNW
ncbi:hypothetical protein I302_101074 [Kwoniella bestiolae CBS 10118]|uniref:Protein yippee-like n=1 Tax=Kwoniella bestiolae CBS 10118 TaxID=1296100 RepID=A0A1B9G6Z3_9TREE|nr:hypothetical protein I302_04450 [Kwoniella bestiolae CBS 10118]OCF26761.1 hypothetical protein I302_04450 [Kwoniella bestiolae CBS 10118]